MAVQWLWRRSGVRDVGPRASLVHDGAHEEIGRDGRGERLSRVHGREGRAGGVQTEERSGGALQRRQRQGRAAATAATVGHGEIEAARGTAAAALGAAIAVDGRLQGRAEARAARGRVQLPERHRRRRGERCRGGARGARGRLS